MTFLFNASGVELVILLCVRLLIVFAILPIHEFAHGYAAKKLGDKTALICGRLTLNPLAHVDPVGAILLILCGFGWAKPVPVNPRNFANYKKDNAIVAFAGPLSNFICALAAIMVETIYLNVLSLLPMTSSIFKAVTYISGIGLSVADIIELAIYNFAIINLSLAIFNLIPVQPLDGSHILSYFLPSKANAWIYKNGQILRIVFMILLFSSVISGPLSWLISKFYELFSLMFIWIDWLFALFTV